MSVLRRAYCVPVARILAAHPTLSGVGERRIEGQRPVVAQRDSAESFAVFPLFAVRFNGTPPQFVEVADARSLRKSP